MMLILGNTVWKMHATHGVSLEITFNLMGEKEIYPTWDGIFEAAHQDGANLKRLKDRLILCIQDSYPKELHSLLEKKLNLLYSELSYCS